jgi:DNA-binding protein HU-beta
MDNKELIDLVSKEVKTSKSNVNKVLDSLLNVIKNKISEGDSVKLEGFGNFFIVERTTREGHNPKIDEELQIINTKTVKFVVGKDFKNLVNSI